MFYFLLYRYVEQAIVADDEYVGVIDVAGCGSECSKRFVVNL